MEILKFDEAGSSSPSRKRSGRGAILVTFVALVFGAGTALASGTLTINGTDTVALAQGVVQTVQCDSDGINMAIVSNYNPTEGDFIYDGVRISGISSDCETKYFTIKTYNNAGRPALQEFCIGQDAVDADLADDITAIDAGCEPDGKSAKKRVYSDDPATTGIDESVMSFSFTKKLSTGNPGIVNVSRVTVESSDS